MLHVAARKSGAVTFAARSTRSAASDLARRDAGLPLSLHIAFSPSVTGPAALKAIPTPVISDSHKHQSSRDQQIQNVYPSIRAVNLETKASAVRRARSKIERYKIIKAKADATRRSLTPSHVDMKDWKIAYRLLLNHTPKDPEAFKKQVRVVKITTSHGSDPLTIDTNRYLLTLRLQSGAQAWTLPDPAPGSRYLTIQGVPHQIEDAIAKLKEQYTSIETVSEEKIQNLLDDSRWRIRSTLNWVTRSEDKQRSRTLNEIGVPITMTTIEFASYVRDITLTKPPRLRMKTDSQHLTGSVETHQRRVSQILVALFKTVSLRSCWSSQASEMALRYLGKHRLYPQARMVLHELEQGQGAKQTAVYDAFLTGPSTAQDLKNFQYGLEVMIRHGVSPSPFTWVLFLRMMNNYDTSICQDIIKEMRTLQMFANPSVRVEIMGIIVPIEYQKWLEGGGSIQGFLEHIASEWTIDSVYHHNIIWELLLYHLHRAQFAEVEVVLNLYIHNLKRQVIRRDILSLCLSNAHRHGNVGAAVKLCKLIIPHTSGHLDGTSINYLFWLAWQRQYLCMVNVLWRYGCLTGHVSYITQNIIRGSILCSPDVTQNLLDLVEKSDDAVAAPTPQEGTYKAQDPTTLVPSKVIRQGVFNRIAAVVSIGLQLGVVEGQNSTRSHGKSPVYMNKQERLAIMKQDMETGGNYRTIVSFEDMLEEAYHRDLEMKRKGFPNTLAGVVAMCPQLPLIEKRSADSAGQIKAKARTNEFYTSVHKALTSKTGKN